MANVIFNKGEKMKDCKNITLDEIEKNIISLNLHTSVLKTFPTIISTLAEQLNEDNLYNALHDVAFIQDHFLNDVFSKITDLEKMICLLNGKAMKGGE